MTGVGGERRSQSLVREAVGLFGEYQRTGDQPLLTRAISVDGRLPPAVTAPLKEGHLP